MIKKIFPVLLIAFTVIFSQTDNQYNSYLAHIAAANSSLRLNEPTEANRWIKNAPEKYSGWEWNLI